VITEDESFTGLDSACKHLIITTITTFVTTDASKCE